MTTSDSQISPQTPKQDENEVEKVSLDNPKQLREAIPSVPQALPPTPAPDHYEDDAAESSPAEDADTKTETESEVQIQDQVQPQDQHQVKPSNLTIGERSKEPLVREEDEKPSPDPELVTEQEPEIPHGPLTANRPSDDDKVENVKDNSLIPGEQHIIRENIQNSDSVANKEGVSDATLIDHTACRTQPKEPIKKDSLAGVNAEQDEEEGKEEKAEKGEKEEVVVVEGEEEEEEEEETIYCNVIGSTTGRPCRFPASQCTHHRDSQGRVLIFCNVIGSTTGRPCRFPASQCTHHRDSQGRVLIFCNVIGSTTGRPCRFPASKCPHHRDSQGRVLIYCNVIGRTTGRPCRFLASKCPHH
ncbi:MAG: hypothetical protein JOS17DRAFT_746414 [Linnemannia elongata]|nr:MAG: hypothetical protein JOS17DRAFT_746414 [Linnemannia elongata]